MQNINLQNTYLLYPWSQTRSKNEEEDGVETQRGAQQDSKVNAQHNTSWSDQDNQEGDYIDEGSYTTEESSAGIREHSQGNEVAQPVKFKLRNRDIFFTY